MVSRLESQFRSTLLHFLRLLESSASSLVSVGCRKQGLQRTIQSNPLTCPESFLLCRCDRLHSERWASVVLGRPRESSLGRLARDAQSQIVWASPGNPTPQLLVYFSVLAVKEDRRCLVSAPICSCEQSRSCSFRGLGFYEELESSVETQRSVKRVATSHGCLHVGSWLLLEPFPDR
jgi:hypothetical protein